MAPRAFLRRVLAGLVLGLAIVPAPAADDGFHPERLPWITGISRTIRHGAHNVLWQERNRLVRKRNEEGRQYVWFYGGEFVEMEDGQPVTWAIVQRCLGDRMVTERWKYRIERTPGGNWRVASREKVMEFDGMYRSIQQPADNAHPTKPFEFRHGALVLRFEKGHALPTLTNGHLDEFLLHGDGHVHLEPPSFTARQLFRNGTGKEILDAKVYWARFVFNALDEEDWLARLGWTPETLRTPGTGFPDERDNRRVEKNNRELAAAAYRPNQYYIPERPLARGWFYVRFGTNRGVYTYEYVPWWPREVLVRKGRDPEIPGKGLTYEPVLLTWAPETAELPLSFRDARRDEVAVRPLHYDALFEIDRERLDVVATIELEALRRTRFISFPLDGAPKIHYVRDAAGRELLVLPSPRQRRIPRFGHEKVTEWTVVLPEPVPAGRHLRLRFCYSNPAILLTTEDWLALAEPTELLPFLNGLGDAARIHCVVRSDARWRHAFSGNLVAEKVVDGTRYTEWDSGGPVEIALLAAGGWLAPRTLQVDGVRVTGLIAPRFYGRNLRVPRAEFIDPFVQRVAASLGFFRQLFGVPCPWQGLRVLGVPPGLATTRPAPAAIFLGEYYFWPAVRREKLDLRNPAKTSGTLTFQLAHQWWGGAIRPVSWEHRWVQEGLARLSEALHDEAAEAGWYRKHVRTWRTVALRADGELPLRDWGVDYAGSTWSAAQELLYYKSPLVFHMLGVYFGTHELRQYLRELAREFAGRPLSTWDVQAVAEKTFGMELGWFFDEWVRGIGHPRVLWRAGEPRPDPAGNGWLVDLSLRQELVIGKRTIRDHPFRHLLVPVRLVPPAGAGDPAWRRVVLDGTDTRRTLHVPFRPDKVEIDPEGAMLFVVAPLKDDDGAKEEQAATGL